MSEELKPCPFCGSKPNWCGDDPSDPHLCHQIACDCGIQIDASTKQAQESETMDELRTEMARLWNDRHITQRDVNEWIEANVAKIHCSFPMPEFDHDQRPLTEDEKEGLDRALDVGTKKIERPITLDQAKQVLAEAGMAAVPVELLQQLEKYFHRVNMTYEGSELTARFQAMIKAAQEKPDA